MTAQAMTRACTAWLGTGEPNQIQTWYAQRNGPDYNYNFPWCDAGITRAAIDAGEYQAVCFGQDQAYTPAHAQMFKNNGQWTYGVDGCQEGDIVFFDWGMTGGPGTGHIADIDHVEYCTGRQGDLVLTIGFNTQDVCARRVRDANTIVGYGRPNYSQYTPPAPTPQPTALPPLNRAIERELVNYCEGDDVLLWQTYMHDVRGWRNLVKDGKYGGQSETTCRAFQQDSTAHGWPLKADGIVGPKTLFAMTHRPITR